MVKDSDKSSISEEADMRGFFIGGGEV